MALDTPSTQSLADDIRSQISAKIDQTIPVLPKSFVVVLAKVLAAAIILVYKYAGRSYLDMFVATSSTKQTTVAGKTLTPLIELGRQFGVGDPLPATAAELVLTVTVQVQTGSIAAGTQLLYAPTGVIYVTKAAVSLNAATVPVTVRAASVQGDPDSDGTGDVGNLQVGDELQFANPLSNVARTAVVASVAVTGADAEDLEDYRVRVTRRCQARPQGGALADYAEWAEGVAGILHAYPYTSATPGEVDVYVEATEESSGSSDGIPTSDQLDDVAEAIELDTDGLATRRPVTAAVNVLAITRKAFDVTITGLEVADGDDESDVQDSITDAIDEYLRTLEPFITGLSVLPRVDRVTQGAVAGVADDAASALGATITNVTVSVGGGEVSAYTLADGEKAKLGTRTFV
jgi:uncharacterized phage protein gp47/JayE